MRADISVTVVLTAISGRMATDVSVTAAPDDAVGDVPVSA
jgi:hypothetical protein